MPRRRSVVCCSPKPNSAPICPTPICPRNKMAAIDATARVADGAHIGDGVEIGPYCLVGPDVELKDGVRLLSHVNVTGATTIGEGTVVYPFASLGTPPQSVHFHGEP